MFESKANGRTNGTNNNKTQNVKSGTIHTKSKSKIRQIFQMSSIIVRSFRSVVTNVVSFLQFTLTANFQNFIFAGSSIQIA